MRNKPSLEDRIAHAADISILVLNRDHCGIGCVLMPNWLNVICESAAPPPEYSRWKSSALTCS